MQFTSIYYISCIQTESGYDKLWIYKEYSTENNIIHEYMGTHTGVILNLNLNQVFIRYTTDASVVFAGFNISISHV